MTENQLNKLTGLFIVLLIHGALLYMAISYKLIPPPVKLDKPHPIEQPKPEPVVVSEAPVTSATEPVAPPPPPEPVKETQQVIEPAVVAAPKPAAPVMMSSELSLACPKRTSPIYPAISRRIGEQGQVKLRVELDETGKITYARVVESSGYKRLDDAGLAAIKSWQCNAITRDGKPASAIALQPFEFILEGR